MVLALADKDSSSSMVFHRSDDLIIVSRTVNVTLIQLSFNDALGERKERSAIRDNLIIIYRPIIL